MLFKEPRAATAGASDTSEIFRTTKGSDGKDIGPYTEANEKRPGCRNRSILCLSELKLSVENTGLESLTGTPPLLLKIGNKKRYCTWMKWEQICKPCNELAETNMEHKFFFSFDRIFITIILLKAAEDS